MTVMGRTPYALRTPCRECPFRSDVPPYLRPERAREIAAKLQDGAGFSCHKTTVLAEVEEGREDLVPGPKSQECAGALITMERQGFSSQSTRIAERLGMYDPRELNMDAPVYASLTEWVRSYAPADEDTPHCDVVGPDCEDPPGTMTSGGVSLNTDPGISDDECTACGGAVCPSCRADCDGLTMCVFCAEQA